MSERLQLALQQLHSRFGVAAPQLAPPTVPARPSGIPEVDALTGIGGWPAGRLSLLAGSRGSGKRTLAIKTVAYATQQGPAVYVDVPARLDPEGIVRAGGVLDRLLVVRPRSLKEAMDSARVLARAGADFVCLDIPRPRDAALDAELPHLVHRAAEAGCTVLLIHETAEEAISVRYYASLIIGLERKAWVFRPDGDLAGLEVEAATVKNRMAPPVGRVRWVLHY
jgi:recA bacterial DNA recombination protein